MENALAIRHDLSSLEGPFFSLSSDQMSRFWHDVELIIGRLPDTFFFSSLADDTSGEKCTPTTQVLTGSTGVIVDGPGLYSNNMLCSWRIEAPGVNQVVVLTVQTLDTECGLAPQAQPFFRLPVPSH